jgi:hypothetical protein
MRRAARNYIDFRPHPTRLVPLFPLECAWLDLTTTVTALTPLRRGLHLPSTASAILVWSHFDSFGIVTNRRYFFLHLGLRLKGIHYEIRTLRTAHPLKGSSTSYYLEIGDDWFIIRHKYGFRIPSK